MPPTLAMRRCYLNDRGGLKSKEELDFLQKLRRNQQSIDERGYRSR